MPRNRDRRWVELLAVSFVRALNHSKVPRSVTIVYTHMWHTAGQPWSISSLADASSLDRASVRDCLNKMPQDQGDMCLLPRDFGGYTHAFAALFQQGLCGARAAAQAVVVLFGDRLRHAQIPPKSRVSHDADMP